MPSAEAKIDRATGARLAALSRMVSIVLAVLLLAIGLLLGWGGIALIAEGGSIYYLLAAGALLAVAIALFRRHNLGAWIYGAFLAVTDLWALWESGPDGWALLPRLALFTALGLPFLVPAFRAAHPKGPRLAARPAKAGGLALVVVPTALVVIAFTVHALRRDGSEGAALVPDMAGNADAQAVSADWPSYGGTTANQRFSTLSAITPDNVSKLRVAWTYTFGEGNPVSKGLQVTPIKIGDSLYACNGTNTVVSLDPDTGKERWRFEPKLDFTNIFAASCRGVAYYRVPQATGPCAERIFTNTVDARLIAIDARTGKRCKDFGRNGEISLMEGMGEFPKGYYFLSSAPTVARGRVVVGGGVLDNQFWKEPSGVIRAFDAVTGKLSWAYDVGRPDRVGAPGPGETYTPSTPNSWGPMAYDDRLGMIYVPVGAPTPDYFGGQRRPFDEEITGSVMALDITTGRRCWVYQIVHHDLWDYDVTSPPVLVDLPDGDRVVPALLQATKRGEVFSINRATGEPLDSVERPVSQVGAAPEERLAPTQPFPRRMPSLAGGRLTEQMMWGLTPLDQLWCRVKFKQARYEGQMTPPGLTPSIMYPGFFGGMNWGGISFDPRRGVMVALTSYVPNYVQLVRRKQADATGVKPVGLGGAADLEGAQAIAIQANLPYAARTKPFLSPLGVPCSQPPFSRLTGVDVRSKKVLWSKPLGSAAYTGPMGIKSHLPFVMGVPSVGSSVVTGSDLTFIGASTDSTFRAFQTSTGKVVWEAHLPASGNSGAMTYQGALGRQYVVIAAGGHRILQAPTSNKLIAYALP